MLNYQKLKSGKLVIMTEIYFWHFFAGMKVLLLASRNDRNHDKNEKNNVFIGLSWQTGSLAVIIYHLFTWLKTQNQSNNSSTDLYQTNAFAFFYMIYRAFSGNDAFFKVRELESANVLCQTCF